MISPRRPTTKKYNIKLKKKDTLSIVNNNNININITNFLSDSSNNILFNIDAKITTLANRQRIKDIYSLHEIFINEEDNIHNLTVYINLNAVGIAYYGGWSLENFVNIILNNTEQQFKLTTIGKTKSIILNDAFYNTENNNYNKEENDYTIYKITSDNYPHYNDIDGVNFNIYNSTLYLDESNNE